jgi:uncharacterized protein
LIAISALTLINHALEKFLFLCRENALVILIGPSTPLSPILFELNKGILYGILMEDEEQVVKAVSQGAIFKKMQGIKRVEIINPQFTQIVKVVLSR